MLRSTQRILARLFLFTAFVCLNSCQNGTFEYSVITVPDVTGVTTTTNEDGSVLVTISGSGYMPGATVTVNGTDCTDVIFVSSTTLKCTLPSTRIALTNIIVTNPGSGGTSNSITPYYIVFVTSGVYEPNLGINTFDSNCRLMAQVGTATKDRASTRTWHAVMSTSSASAASRIHLTAGVEIKNTAGQTVLSDASKLFNSAYVFESSPGYDESGNPKTGGAWNGGNSIETPKCENWTTRRNENMGRLGSVSATNQDQWISITNATCDSNYPIICISAND